MPGIRVQAQNGSRNASVHAFRDLGRTGPIKCTTENQRLCAYLGVLLRLLPRITFICRHQRSLRVRGQASSFQCLLKPLQIAVRIEAKQWQNCFQKRCEALIRVMGRIVAELLNCTLLSGSSCHSLRNASVALFAWSSSTSASIRTTFRTRCG
jgi:hypothetical protein